MCYPVNLVHTPTRPTHVPVHTYCFNEKYVTDHTKLLKLLLQLKVCQGMINFC